MDDTPISSEDEPTTFAEALDAAAAPDATEQAAEPRMVPWDEYVRLRRENAEYRKRWQPYDQTFSRLDPQVREAFLDLAAKYAEDPAQAALELAAAFGIPLDDDPEPRPSGLTREDLRSEMEAFFAEQRAQAMQAQELQQNRELVQQTARELGIEPGTKEYRRLLTIARDEFSVDEFGEPVSVDQAIRAAYQAITEELGALEQQVIKRYLDGKGSQGGVRVTGSGEAPSTEQPIDDLTKARAAMRSWLDAGAPAGS